MPRAARLTQTMETEALRDLFACRTASSVTVNYLYQMYNLRVVFTADSTDVDSGCEVFGV